MTTDGKGAPPAGRAPAEKSDRTDREFELNLDIWQVLLVTAVLATIGAGLWFLPIRQGTDEASRSPATVDFDASLQDRTASGELSFYDRLAQGDRKAPGAAASGGSASGRGVSPPVGEVATERAGLEPVGGQVHAPSGPPPGAGSKSEQKSPSHPVTGRFAVQVFAGDRKGGEALRSRLSGKGYSVEVVPAGASKVRVRVVGYASRTEAQTAANQLAASEKLKVWIVPTTP